MEFGRIRSQTMEKYRRDTMMKPLKTAVIGMGTMGSKYAAFLLNGQVPAMELAAVTRVRPERLKVMNLTLRMIFRSFHLQMHFFRHWMKAGFHWMP